MSDEDVKKFKAGMDNAVGMLCGSIENSFEADRIMSKRKADAENAMIKMNKRLKKMRKRIKAQDVKQAAAEKRNAKSELFNRIVALLALVVAILAIVVPLRIDNLNREIQNVYDKHGNEQHPQD